LLSIVGISGGQWLRLRLPAAGEAAALPGSRGALDPHAVG